MAIRRTTSDKAFEKFLNECNAIIKEEIVRALSFLGEKCKNRIRDRSAVESWIDQTGNLRSSIGYAIFDHGQKTIESEFSVVKEGKQGADKGRKMIQDLASLYSTTFALVVVAGMEYAEYVEARDNKDVLASTELWAREQLSEALKMAHDRAIKRIDKLRI